MDTLHRATQKSVRLITPKTRFVFSLILFVCGFSNTLQAAERNNLLVDPEVTLSDESAEKLRGALDAQITRVRQQLQKVLEQRLHNDPRIERLQSELETRLLLNALYREMIPLSLKTRNEEEQKELVRLSQERDKLLETLTESRKPETILPNEGKDDESSPALSLREELRTVKQRLAQSQKELIEATQQLTKQEHDRTLPQIENGELKVFNLRKLPAADAAKTIDRLFGAKSMRVAIDDRTNSIIVLGKPESLAEVESTLVKLDQLPPQEAPKQKPQESDQPSARPLLVKMFWLADGLPAEDGKDPAEALPASVLRATTKLGLTDPRLVAQTVNSIVIRGDEGSQFSVNMPVQLLQEEVNLSSQGHISFRQQDKANLEIGVKVSGNSINSDLSGSLTMPLDHFMVLGTSSSMIPESVPVPANTEEIQISGIMSKKPRHAQRFRTSRFAFVVQVVDAESFAPEEK